MPLISSRQDCDSAMSTVTGILRAAKVKSAKGTDNGGHGLGASNSEISKLLAQFPLKSTEVSKAPDNKMVLEETRAIKDFLQNSMFSGLGPREPVGLGPFLLPPPAPPPTAPEKLPELSAQKRQLPVFAKICSKPETDPAVEGHNLTERNPGTKELTKGRESLFLSQWPQSRKDSCGEEGCSDPVGTMSMALPTKKPAWPAEKNLLYEFFGATKNPSGQLKLRSKAEVDGLELKLNPPATTADKNNHKYAGNVYTPRFATALTSATVNQPLWLNVNYPPPPVFSNHSTFPQYQGVYPPRAPRMPYQQTVHPPMGCYSRQVTPYNPQQMGQQQIFRSSYTPLLSYIPFVQPNYPYPQRTPPKMSANPRDPSPMAGDGPQYLFPQAYGFGSTSGGPVMNSPYFSSSGNGINF
uniref:Chromosome 1 open reading frame 94 n=1 Tax=Otolemur garnettii TaxID=30611 RepID=H0X463_OTOGA